MHLWNFNSIHWQISCKRLWHHSSKSGITRKYKILPYVSKIFVEVKFSMHCTLEDKIFGISTQTLHTLTQMNIRHFYHSLSLFLDKPKMLFTTWADNLISLPTGLTTHTCSLAMKSALYWTKISTLTEQTGLHKLEYKAQLLVQQVHEAHMIVKRR